MIDFFRILETIKKKNKKICLFGAGFLGRTFGYKLLKTAGLIVDFYSDNNPKLHGKTINDVIVISPEELYQLRDRVQIFISVKQNLEQDIFGQLVDHGISEESIIFADYYLMQQIIEYVNESDNENDKEQWKDFIDDEIYLKWRFKSHTGYDLNLTAPRTFNEKLQWLKLNDRQSKYTMMVDKNEVKKYVSSKIGDEYVIPSLGVWDHYDDIDFGTLPNRFVLKCTHDSGSVVICQDKNTFDKCSAQKKLEYALKRNFYYSGREWPYKDVKARILAEQFLTADQELRDYKFMCFNGRVLCSFVCSERFSGNGLKVTFYDRDWKRMPFSRHYPSAPYEIAKPEKYDEMVELAETLSEGIPFVRVDFYETNESVFFGEMTFFPGGGFEEFEPFEWDLKLGSWIDLDRGVLG